MRKTFIIVVSLFALLIVLLPMLLPPSVSIVCFEDNCFRVEVAVTGKERSRGLMFREKLDSNEGMLFLFQDEEKHPFWMKNVSFPLDIIWIDKDRRVVFVSEDNQPCQDDNCPIIIPEKSAKYVLELSGGTVEQIGLIIGEEVIFNSEGFFDF